MTKGKQSSAVCPLCKQAGRPKFQHYLSACKYLPANDREYIAKTRQTSCPPECEEDAVDDSSESEDEDLAQSHNHRITATLRRVSTKQSPYMKVFYKQFPLQITLDTGAEISMI